MKYRPYAYDVIISLRPLLGNIGLHVNAIVSDVPAADHKHIQGNGFCSDMPALRQCIWSKLLIIFFHGTGNDCSRNIPFNSIHNYTIAYGTCRRSWKCDLFWSHSKVSFLFGKVFSIDPLKPEPPENYFREDWKLYFIIQIGNTFPYFFHTDILKSDI